MLICSGDHEEADVVGDVFEMYLAVGLLSSLSIC